MRAVLRAPLETDGYGFRAASAALELEEVSLVEVYPVRFQELAILLLKGLRPMMLRLSGDVSPEVVDPFSSDGKGCVAILPAELCASHLISCPVG